jgi:hypothetical protein
MTGHNSDLLLIGRCYSYGWHRIASLAFKAWRRDVCIQE